MTGNTKIKRSKGQAIQRSKDQKIKDQKIKMTGNPFDQKIKITKIKRSKGQAIQRSKDQKDRQYKDQKIKSIACTKIKRSLYCLSKDLLIFVLTGLTKIKRSKGQAIQRSKDQKTGNTKIFDHWTVLLIKRSLDKMIANTKTKRSKDKIDRQYKDQKIKRQKDRQYKDQKIKRTGN